MIDFHTHTTLSDGELLPYELVRRAHAAGYRVIGLSDHVDGSTVDFVVPRLLEAARSLSGLWGVKVIAGAELTHVPPDMIDALVKEARRLGAQMVIVHGETLVEPVAPGTNMAGIKAGVDILAHPGLITEEEVLLARQNGVSLEITARKGHSLANGHVAGLSIKHGAKMVINTDSHSPGDLISKEMALRVLLGAGLSSEAAQGVFDNAEVLSEKLLRRNI